MSDELLHPLHFDRVVVAKPWAGPGLGRIFPQLDHRLPQGTGETVEISTVPGIETPISNGNATGMTLSQLAEKVGWKALLGWHADDFPLMVKFLDTSRNLSVQVHPSDRISGGKVVEPGKCESWFVLDASADALIWQGIDHGIKDEAFWAVIQQGDPRDVLVGRPVRGGDFLDSPSGLVHAIGAGIALVEIQQNSNTTFRLYDWPENHIDGKPREIHLDEARSCLKTNLANPPIHNALLDTGNIYNHNEVLRNGYPYTIEYHRVSEHCTLSWSERCQILICLEGEASAECSLKGHVKQTFLEGGDVVLIPAAFEEIEITPRPNVSLLQVTPVEFSPIA